MSKQNNKVFTEPWVDKLITCVGVFFSAILGNRLSTGIIYWFYLILLSWYASSQLRQFLSNNLLSSLIVFLLIVIMLVYGRIIKKILPKNEADGNPIFDDLGGPGKRLLNKTDEAHSYIYVELNERDIEFYKQFREKHLEGYKKRLRERYYQQENQHETFSGTVIRSLSGEKDLEDSKWQERWTKILNTPLKTMTFGDMFGEDYVTCQVSMAFFSRSIRYSSALFALCNLFILIMAFQYINHEVEYVSFLRCAALLGAISAAAWTIVGMYKFSSMGLKSELEPDIRHDTSFRKIKLESGFYRVVRHFVILNLIFFYLIYIPIYLLCIGGSAVLLGLVNGTLSVVITEWHVGFFLNVLFGNLILVVTFYSVSLAIQQYRVLFAGLDAALIAFVLPHAVIFLMSGESRLLNNGPSLADVASFFVSAFAGAMGSVVVKQFKKAKN